MTEPFTGKNIGLVSLFVKAIPFASILTVLLTAMTLGLVSMFGEWTKEKLKLASSEDLAEISESLNQIHDQLDLLKRQVAVAARPEQIAVYIQPPRATQGYCIAGSTCRISVLASRDPRAESCELLARDTRLVIVANNVEYFATPIMPRGTNVGTRPTGVEPQFDIPSNVPSGTWPTQIETAYTDCDWQVDGVPPTTSMSPFFDLEIR